MVSDYCRKLREAASTHTLKQDLQDSSRTARQERQVLLEWPAQDRMAEP
jgi:hypothetical protein